jgi:hypothetical protein
MIHSRLKVILLAMFVVIAVVGCQNHFTIYRVTPATVDFQALVAGQLDPAPKQVHLLKLTHFANPAKKQHSGTVVEIHDKNAHLNWYDISQTAAEPLRTVRFKNQFGQHSVRFQAPRSLLVPAQKTSDPASTFPDSLDHYKCYEVVHVSLVPTLPSVTLTDQFGTEQNLPVGPPRFFCVPVSKQKPGAPPEPIKNKKNHLAIYELPPKDKDVEIATKDQFGDRELKVNALVFLAVPTEKQVVVPAPP